MLDDGIEAYSPSVDAYRVWADVDLDALAHNLAVIRDLAGDRVALMLVVKADAYGHGALAVAHHAVRCGVSSLGVGTSAEALELRHGGVRVPILVLGTIVDEEAAAALRHGIHIGLHTTDRAVELQNLGKRLDLCARVHLNIDTGMGRLGMPPERALDLLTLVRDASHLELSGVMTHISSPRGALDPATACQIERFDAVLAEARARGLLGGWIHAANSACVFTGLDPLYDVIRPGISAYGVLPGGLPHADRLEPVLSLRSQVVFLKDVCEGTPIGYGSTFRAGGPTRIATIPVGYNDGVPWRTGNLGCMLVRGQRAPIVGRVSMDYTTIDVTAVRDVRVGERVTLIGRDGEAFLGLEEVAEQAGTIPYEITCSVGKRVQRVYQGGEDWVMPRPAPRGMAGPAPEPTPGPPGRRQAHSSEPGLLSGGPDGRLG